MSNKQMDVMDDDGGSSSGGDEERDKLLVFGYGCKVYRDDEKAQFIEDGKHLIPWMGEQNLLIDRYDGRGTLTDLYSLESPAKVELSPEEKETERLCDAERYREYDENKEFIDTDYQEEEFRRLQLAVSEISNDQSISHHNSVPGYAAIAYSYNDNNSSSNNNAAVSGETPRMGPERKKVKDNSPYVKPPGLFPPPDVILPKTMKSHAIIEKTAKFIASQEDGQMEIILKTKQANNPQFEFLNFSDPLNPYYRFLVTAIHTCAYQPSEDMPISPDESPENSGTDDDDDSGEGYLHPSLASSNTSMSTFISQSSYKPITGHSAYSMLVSKIKEVSTTSLNHSPPVSPYTGLGSAQLGPDQQLKVESENRPMPTSQEQVIIDKMANYVVKNGPEFERLANHKGDPRFMFIDPTHPFHWYYLNCKERYNALAASVVANRLFVGYPTGTTDQRPSSSTSNDADDELSTSTSSGSSASLIKVRKPLSTPVPPSTPVSTAAPDHANALSRMAKLPPALISKIDALRRRTLLNRMRNEDTGTGPGEGPHTTSDLSSSTSFDSSNDILNVSSSSSSLSSSFLKPKREPLIKFSPTLSQRVIPPEPAAADSESSELESPFNSLLEMNGSGSKRKKDVAELNEQEIEAVRLRKEERRKKATLFLQQLKDKNMESIMETDESAEPQPKYVKIQDEKENKESDRESVASQNVMKNFDSSDNGEMVKSGNSNDSAINDSLDAQSKDNDLKKSSGQSPDVVENSTAPECRTSKPMRSDSVEEVWRSKRGKTKRKRSKKGSCSKSNSESEDSSSEEGEYHSSSSSAHRKKSKRKHSKKRRREEKSSHSKKSKKARYDD